MTQTTIPVQPHETPVTGALRVLSAVAGWCVTATTNGQHATNSLHYVGRAVDLASFDGPGTDTVQLLDINEQVVKLLPRSMISELIYAGPGAICIHDGQVVNGLAVYGAETMAEHHNHVHLGVIPTFTYTGPEVDPMALAPIVAMHSTPSGNGYWLIDAAGAVYAFGDAPYHGGLQPNGDNSGYVAVGVK